MGALLSEYEKENNYSIKRPRQDTPRDGTIPPMSRAKRTEETDSGDGKAANRKDDTSDKDTDI